MLNKDTFTQISGINLLRMFEPSSLIGFENVIKK